MIQTVVIGFPPNFAHLREVFGPSNVRGAIFSWGDTLFNPYRIALSEALIAHEARHGARQGRSEETIRHWWNRYVHDKEFRLHEEILGHQAEFRSFCRDNVNSAKRARAALAMADRLSGPLYGHAIGFGEAKHRIIDGLTIEG